MARSLTHARTALETGYEREYEAAGSGIGAAWKETLGRNFPPSTLLFIDGLVDVRAKVEIEVTAFVPAS